MPKHEVKVPGAFGDLKNNLPHVHDKKVAEAKGDTASLTLAKVNVIAGLVENDSSAARTRHEKLVELIEETATPSDLEEIKTLLANIAQTLTKITQQQRVDSDMAGLRTKELHDQIIAQGQRTTNEVRKMLEPIAYPPVIVEAGHAQPSFLPAGQVNAFGADHRSPNRFYRTPAEAVANAERVEEPEDTPPLQPALSTESGMYYSRLAMRKEIVQMLAGSERVFSAFEIWQAHKQEPGMYLKRMQTLLSEMERRGEIKRVAQNTYASNDYNPQ